MQMPFTIEQFFGVFADYNTSIWPAQIVLTVLGVTAIALCMRKQVPSHVVSAILGILWAWTGIVYHLVFFTTINPAAVVFGILCVAQAGLFLTVGTIRRGLVFQYVRSWRGYLGATMLLYALVLYPLWGYALGHSYPASPTFGAPCPTTIFTFGLLLWTTGRLAWYVYAIPFVWSLIGFNAVLAFGILEDAGLLLSGLVGTAVLAFWPNMQAGVKTE